MKVGLVGFGNTGKSVAAVLMKNPLVELEWVLRKSTSQNHRPAAEILDLETTSAGRILSASAISAGALMDRWPVDVVIDFSSEDGIDYYGDVAADRGANIVSAISHYPIVKQRKLERLSRRTAVLWSPNITVGVNFLILAAQTLHRIAPGTDIEIIEEHFKGKNGVSGTARIISTALGVDEQDIKSIRAGGIIGAHEILFGLPNQTIRLRHESISREAFGSGAMFAAERLTGMPPGLYKMEDLLVPFFGSHAWTPKPTWRDRVFRVGSLGSSSVRGRSQIQAVLDVLTTSTMDEPSLPTEPPASAPSGNEVT
ncbi:MAG TPA: dihydrodipicolinate reductase C-terminal domain-containing protein [Acidimicrobiales bacterium]|nr:dihydrodipicolinate reductase C-terminal domain-containing protein [Acidimicrobiales bacterium]